MTELDRSEPESIERECGKGWYHSVQDDRNDRPTRPVRGIDAGTGKPPECYCEERYRRHIENDERQEKPPRKNHPLPRRQEEQHRPVEGFPSRFDTRNGAEEDGEEYCEYLLGLVHRALPSLQFQQLVEDSSLRSRPCYPRAKAPGARGGGSINQTGAEENQPGTPSNARNQCRTPRPCPRKSKPAPASSTPYG